MVNANVTEEDREKESAYFSNDGDVEAYDQLPEIWRQRLAACPVLYSAKSTLQVLKQYPEYWVLERYREIIKQACGVELDENGFPPRLGFDKEIV